MQAFNVLEFSDVIWLSYVNSNYEVISEMTKE